nr:hypothetical protein [Tanacetum cinerariifolium]
MRRLRRTFRSSHWGKVDPNLTANDQIDGFILTDEKIIEADSDLESMPELSKTDEAADDHMIDELVDLNSLSVKVENLESSLSQQVADKIDDLVPRLVADAIEERLLELLSDTLKNLLPDLLNDSGEHASEHAPTTLTALIVQSPSEEPPAKKLKFMLEDFSIPSPTYLNSIRPPTVINNIPFEKFSANLFSSSSSEFSLTSPVKVDKKGKGKAQVIDDDQLKQLLPFMDEGGSDPKLPNLQ